MITRVCGEALPVTSRQKVSRHCSRYVKYTAWFTCPIASQSRNRTLSRWRYAHALPRASLPSDIAVEYPTTVAFPTTSAETFTPDETRALAPYFTNTDCPV